MPPFSVTFKGQKEMQEKIRVIAKEYPKTAKRAVVTVAERLMTKIKAHDVPVDLGNLRDTGIVIPDPDPRSIGCTLAFGGPGVEYAEKVHEDLKAHHTVGRARYVAAPLEENAEQIPIDVAKEAQL